jgi:solute carrier family 35 (adenosine 3'-phospho 5'-phosphosulfate transporter), member B2
MIPVMVIGTLISGKRYGLEDYGAAASISIGCMVFLLTGVRFLITQNQPKYYVTLKLCFRFFQKFAQSDDDDSNSSLLGLALVLGYLFCDGFTSTLQEKMFKGYTMSTYQQMFYTNLISVGFSLIGLSETTKVFLLLSYFPSVSS